MYGLPLLNDLHRSQCCSAEFLTAKGFENIFLIAPCCLWSTIKGKFLSNYFYGNRSYVRNVYLCSTVLFKSDHAIRNPWEMTSFVIKIYCFSLVNLNHDICNVYLLSVPGSDTFSSTQFIYIMWRVEILLQYLLLLLQNLLSENGKRAWHVKWFLQVNHCCFFFFHNTVIC